MTQTQETATFKIIEDRVPIMCEVVLESGQKLTLFIDGDGLHVELIGNRAHTLAVKSNTLAIKPSCYNGGICVFPFS